MRQETVEFEKNGEGQMRIIGVGLKSLSCVRLILDPP
jgi:hypothetical protein